MPGNEKYYVEKSTPDEILLKANKMVSDFCNYYSSMEELLPHPDFPNGKITKELPTEGSLEFIGSIITNTKNSLQNEIKELSDDEKIKYNQWPSKALNQISELITSKHSHLTDEWSNIKKGVEQTLGLQPAPQVSNGGVSKQNQTPFIT